MFIPREEIENIFTHHSPTESQIDKYEQIRSTAKEFAYLLYDECPHTREYLVAMGKLEECVMWANASIARKK